MKDENNFSNNFNKKLKNLARGVIETFKFELDDSDYELPITCELGNGIAAPDEIVEPAKNKI